MKRSRESSSKTQEECEQLAEENVSGAKKRKVAVATCPNEKPRAAKRVSFNNNRTFKEFDVQ